jgi:uncharacterized protein (TIGR03437 family)
VTVNSADHPAPLGSILTLYASGPGVLSPALPDGSVAPNSAPQPTAKIRVYMPRYLSCGDELEPVLYAGGSPGLVQNVLQVNFRLERQVVFMQCAADDSIYLTAGNVAGQLFNIYWQ